MGVLPLQFKGEDSWESLGLLGDETVEVWPYPAPVSYTHLRAHETVLDLVCRLLLENTHTDHNLNTQHLIHSKLIT